MVIKAQIIQKWQNGREKLIMAKKITRPGRPDDFVSQEKIDCVKAGKQLVLQQTYHIVTHTSPHRVTSSNIHQIEAQSLGSSKLHDATIRAEGEIFYGPSTEGTPNTLV